MATYYGYKERTDPSKSMIDWAGITKEITDGLYAESKRREEEKFTLDQNYIKQLNDLNEYSQGLDPTVNQAMLGYVQNYRDYLMQNHKMMKQGVISVNDSKIAKQGALDSFNNLNNVIKGVNAKLDELQKAGGELNDDQMKSLAELVQFKNQQLLIDPKTGTASLAKRNEDGTIDKNTIVPVGAAYQMFTPYEQRSINDDVQKPIKGIGQWTTAASYLTSVSDLRNNKEYNDWVDGVVKEMTADKRTLAAYGASLGLTISGGDIIKKNEAGSISYELTPEARGEVEKAIRSAIEVRIGREVKQTAPSTATLSLGEQKKQRVSSFNTLAQWLTTGDANVGASLVNATGSEIRGIIREGNNLVVINADGSRGVPVKAYDENNVALDAETVLQGLAPSFGLTNVDEVKELAQKFKGQKLFSKLKNVTKSTEFKITADQGTALNLLANNQTKNIITGLPDPIEPAAAAAQMGNLLKGMAVSQAKDISITVDGTNIKVGDTIFPHTDLTGITNAIRNYSGTPTEPTEPTTETPPENDSVNFG